MTVGRPAPVVAHLRRPFWWLLVIFPFLGLVGFDALIQVRHDDGRRDRAIRVQGTLVDRTSGDGGARVRYVHPVTEQDLNVSIVVWDRSRLPAVEGGPVALDADPDDPGGVRLAGDAVPATGDLGWNLPYLALPGLVWARRHWGVRRTERLVAGGGPTFAMLGAIAPAGRRGRRTELHLWALDAAPGAPSVCRVGLLATSHLPIGIVFDVEVKGRPRPFGRLVARNPHTDGILWPAGAALPRGARPRPATVVRPAPLPAETSPPEGAARVRPPWSAIAVGSGLALLGVILLVVVVAVAVRGTNQVRRVERGQRVIAEVTGRNEAKDRLAVVYTLNGERRSARVPVDFEGSYPVGRRYPAHVDPRNPSRLQLASTAYDPMGPFLWTSPPLIAGIVVLGRTGRRWLLAVRLARRGGWRSFEMWTGTESASWSTLVPPGTGQAICSTHLGLTGGGPPTPRGPVPTLAAGDPQPGGQLVLHFHGATRIVTQVGAARRLRWWP